VGGFSKCTHVALGFTPFSGAVLAVSVDTVTLSGASGSLSGSSNYEFDTSQHAHFSLMFDYYLDPELGWHALGALGLSSFVMGQGDSSDARDPIAPPHTALGFGFVLGGGYEHFVSDSVSLGVLPRLMFGWPSGVDEFQRSQSHRLFSLSLMMNVTYH
jgi:hypothetical protein